MDNFIQQFSYDEEQTNSAYENSIQSSGQHISEEDLTTQLVRILSMDGMLPNESEKPILGRELIRKIKPMLKPGYSENSIKNYFSQLSKSENSPIAKTAQGFGYFRRKTTEDIDTTPFNILKGLTDLANDTSTSKRDAQAEEKFRALYILYMERESKFPAHVEHTKSHRGPKGLNKWKFPDVVSLEWNTGVLTQINDRLVLDGSFCEIRKATGDSPFNLISTELKINISLNDFRECFFQCVSNSKWANEAHLVIARKVDDAILARDLKKLGATHGVSIYSFNFDENMLSAFPSADKIRNMKEDQREILVDEFCSNITVIYQANKSYPMDWECIHELRSINYDLSCIFKWIPKCLKDQQPYTLKGFIDKEKEEYNLQYMYKSNTYHH